MQISSLNLAQVKMDPTSENAPTGKGSSAFLNVLLTTMDSSKNVMSKGTAAVSESGKDLIANLKDLLALLETTEISELEGGMNLLDQVISTSDCNLLDMIKNYLGVSNQQWNEMMESVTGEIVPLENSDTQEVQEEQILVLIANLLSMQPKEFVNASSEHVQTAVKAIKLYQLLADHKDTSSNGIIKLNGLIVQLSEKLEMLVSVNKPHTEYLQKSFTQLAAELNQNRPPLTESRTLIQKFEIAQSLQVSSGETVNIEQLTGLQLSPQALTKPEQLTLMDPNRRPVSAEQLLDQFESILAKSTFSRSDGLQKLFIKLNPEHLGSLRIELIQKEQGFVAKILTTNGQAKEILESHLQGLKQAFAAQNLTVERIDISQQLQQQEKFLNRENQQQQHSNRESGNEEQEQKSDEDFSSSFEEALLNLEV